MRNLFIALFALAFALGSAQAKDLHLVSRSAGFAAKTVSYPVRHPKKSARGLKKATKATFRAGYKAGKQVL